MEAGLKDEAKEKLTVFLKENNRRITPERFEILQAALDTDRHFSAEELYLEMRNNNSYVSRATVYKNVELLEECGILAKINFGDGSVRYERRFEKKNHGHIIYDGCGKIEEFSSPRLTALINEISKKYGIRVSGYSFNLFGSCLSEGDCGECVKEEDACITEKPHDNA